MFKQFVLKLLILGVGGVGLVFSESKIARSKDLAVSDEVINAPEFLISEVSQLESVAETPNLLSDPVIVESEANLPHFWLSKTTKNQSLDRGQVKENVPQNEDDLVETVDRVDTVETNVNQTADALQLPRQPEEVRITNQIPLSLDEAIALAKANSRSLQVAQIGVDRSLAVVDEARAALFPTLATGARIQRDLSASGDLGIELDRRNQRNTISEINSRIPELEGQLEAIDNALSESYDPSDPVAVQERVELILARASLQDSLSNAQSTLENTRKSLKDVRNYASTAFSGNINLNYDIYSPQRGATIGLAREQLRISELEVKRVEADLILNVALAYYDLQQAKRQIVIDQADVDVRQKDLQGIRLLLDAALATRLDLLNAEVELDNSIQNLRNSQVQKEIAERNLARLLSLPPSVTPDTAEQIEKAGSWDISLEETIIMAFENRVELQQRLAQRNSAEQQRKIAWAGLKPTVSLFGSYDLLQLYSDDPNVNDLISGNFSTGYSVGVGLNWTFFDGGAASARAKQAEADMAIAEQLYGEDVERIRFEVERAYFQLPALEQNIKTAEQAVEKAQEAVMAAQRRFSAAVNTQTEVLDAQNRLVQAKNNLLNAILGYNRALAELKRAVRN
jgi:outer membrane protein TolC